MYVETVPNRNSPPAILLREAYREDGKVKKRTLANLTDWPKDLVEGFRALLKGGKVIAAEREAVSIRRSLPHGHVAAALGTLRATGLDRVLGPAGDRRRDLVIAMIVSRLIAPASKLATARGLDPATAASSLGEMLSLRAVDEDELYDALDWLIERQLTIEKALARKHLADGVLVLYDVPSSYLEGRCCPLAKLGYNRDGKKGKLQIVYGLLCAADGCPVAVEVFDGDTGDPKTLSAQIAKVKERFGLTRVALVGDRGMITQARLDQEIKPAGLDWITALRAPAIRALLDAGAFQLDLFDERDMASITAPDYPGERLMVCRNPELARLRATKREDLLKATERGLAPIAEAVRRARNPLRGKTAIALKVGAALNKRKMAKHFETTIEDDRFEFRRKEKAIAEEAALDGIYVVRTNLPAAALDDAGAVAAYKEPRRGRAGLPLPQDRGPGGPSHLPLGLAKSEGPRPFVHARLLRRASHARQARAAHLRRRRSRSRGQAPQQRRRQGAAFARRPAQGNHWPDRRRPAGAQLPEPARRPRHILPHPSGDRHQRKLRVHPLLAPHPDPGARVRTLGRQTRPYPVDRPSLGHNASEISYLRWPEKGSSD